ncbi:MAG: FlgD immunoglobulin-like domain containing protein [Chloroflexota bacterium]
MRISYSYLAIIIIVVVAATAIVAVPSLASRPLLSDVQCQPAVITPNGDGVGDEATISYTLGRRATVKIVLTAADGQEYVLRDAMARAPDSYQITFNGAVAIPGTTNSRVLADGKYDGRIEVVDDSGATDRKDFALTVENADSTPPAITEVVAHPPTISPNGDAFEDELTINYTLSKKAETTLYVTDAEGRFYLLDAPKEREAAIQSFLWNGTENGGKLLKDGQYTLHIVAKDKAGNVVEETAPVALDNGGTPRLEIVKVKFTPTAIPLGGKVHVQITVRNTGDTEIKWDESMGPPPGTEYTTQQTYGYWQDKDGKPLYYERNGVWRVGVMWTNAPTVYPVRWGIGKTLAPGEEATITGDVTVLQRNEEIYFWASIEQGGVGFPGGQKGITRVVVSY